MIGGGDGGRGGGGVGGGVDEEGGWVGGGGEGEEEGLGVAVDWGRGAAEEWDGSEVGYAGDGVGGEEAVEVDELAELDGVGIAIGEGEGDVGGVEGVGEL